MAENPEERCSVRCGCGAVHIVMRAPLIQVEPGASITVINNFDGLRSAHVGAVPDSGADSDASSGTDSGAESGAAIMQPSAAGEVTGVRPPDGS